MLLSVSFSFFNAMKPLIWPLPSEEVEAMELGVLLDFQLIYFPLNPTNQLQQIKSIIDIWMKIQIRCCIILLMDKYRLFNKIIKTKAANYFKAEAIDSREGVTVKKLNKSTSWEEILKDRDLAIMKQSKIKYFPAIKEIVKDEDQFYVILEKFDKNLEFVIKADIEKQDILKISRLLIEMIICFAQNKIYPRELRPSHMFVSEKLNNLYLAHLQTIPKDITKLDLVELQDLRYLSPEQVLTSKEIDERSSIFNVGLIICDLILGRSLINANTKMNYMYQICKLFPEQKIIQESNQLLKQSRNTESFDTIMSKYNFSPQFVALIRQMLKIDRNQRVNIKELLDAFDVIAENEKNYVRQPSEPSQSEKSQHKEEEIQQIQLQSDFEEKPTLSTIPTLKNYSVVLPTQKNVQDDAVQPIIIKQSSKPDGKVNLNTTKETSTNKSRVTHNKHPSLSTIRKPQLTNYALNQANIGLQMGMNPSIFSENEI